MQNGEREKQMLQPTTSGKLSAADQQMLPTAVSVEQLITGQESEVLEFLGQRPIHTVAMMSLIRDNGLVSPLNRGTFHSCRDINGQLEGVALVGHATLMETVSTRALRALAQVAQDFPNTHMILGEQDRINEYWDYCEKAGQERRLASRETLLELREPVKSNLGGADINLATSSELEAVVPIQAQLAQMQSGVNPLEKDPEGFRARCLRRIEQGRTWLLLEDGELVFKADIVAQTDEVIYLEGIWVREDKRGSDYGVRCFSQLSRQLLSRARSICLLVNEDNKPAQAFYNKCGCLFRATYETIFLPQKDYSHANAN